jgi:cell division protein FtsB
MFSALQRTRFDRWLGYLPSGDHCLAAAFVALLLLMQIPLWVGKGSWLRVWELDRQVQAAQGANHDRALRNQTLEAEVRDLKDGMEAIEERARLELGMIKPGETLYRYRAEPRADGRSAGL